MRLLEMDDDERARQMQAQFVELGNALNGNISAAMSQAISQIGKQLDALVPLLQQIASLQQQTIAAIKAPKSVSVGGVTTDASGKITGAIVASTPATVNKSK